MKLKGKEICFYICKKAGLFTECQKSYKVQTEKQEKAEKSTLCKKQ